MEGRMEAFTISPLLKRADNYHYSFEFLFNKASILVGHFGWFNPVNNTIKVMTRGLSARLT